MTIKLIIADGNLLYAKKLASALRKNHPSKFNITIITCPEDIARCLKDSDTDVLLLDEGFCQDVFPTIETVFVLVDPDQHLAQNNIDPNRLLNKYQSVHNIARKIIDVCAELKHPFYERFPRKHRTELLCVFSPLGGCGKSTIAVAIAEKYTLMEKNSLYLSLESFPSTHCFYPRTPDQGLSGILKRLDLNTNLTLKLEAYKKRDPVSGTYYFNDSDNLNDMNVLNAEDAIKLINLIQSADLFDYVILDTSAVLTEVNLQLIKLVDEIILVIDDNVNGAFKVDQLLASGILTSEVRSKIRVLFNKVDVIAKDCVGNLQILGCIPRLKDEGESIASAIAKNYSMALLQ